jgi:hypothetical protein
MIEAQPRGIDACGSKVTTLSLGRLEVIGNAAHLRPSVAIAVPGVHGWHFNCAFGIMEARDV